MCPCGKCLSCLINKRKKWSLRILLEALDHDHSSFCTLTYNDEHIEDNQLNPHHLTLFLKRLRHFYKFRYYACGEYGARTHRRHFHVVFFGLEANNEVEQAIQKCWRYGFVYNLPFTPERAEYVAGYVTKKVAQIEEVHRFPSVEDARRMASSRFARRHGKMVQVFSRVPEFARMSRMPALGSKFIDRTKSAILLQHNGHDVASIVRYNGKYYPLDATIKRKCREKFFTFRQISTLKEAKKRELIKESKRLLYEKFGLAYMAMDERNISQSLAQIYYDEVRPLQELAHQSYLRRQLNKKRKAKI